MGQNFFADWTPEMVAEKNRRVALGRSGNADLFEQGRRAGSTLQAAQKVVEKVIELNPGISPKKIPANARSGQWVEIADRRIYFRSTWEVNYSFYLEFLKKHGHILEWDYEPTTFWFDGIRCGTNNYKPDFKVTFPDGKIEYREVKGFLDRKSKTKLKRMKKYHPEVVVRLIDAKWFKANAAMLAQVVPGWSKKK